MNDAGPAAAAAARELALARDRVLARRMARGDTRAVDEFCRHYLPRLLRFALRRLATPEDADEVVQTVLANAARRIATYRGDATLYAWLTGICRREVSSKLDAVARRRVEVSIDGAADDPLATILASLRAPRMSEPDAAAERRQLAGLVWECLDTMPDSHARALEMKYLDGYSSKEIAARLALSDEAVQSLLARARRTFREVCDERLHDDGTTPHVH